jgi:hypothetical protein
MSFSYSPKIVTDGLILCYDPANTKSFISGSTNIYDLSKNNYDGQLINGPVYSGVSNGVISLDATNQRIDIPSLPNSTDGTISVWFKNNVEITSATTAAYLFEFSSGVTISEFRAVIGNVFFATGRTELLTVQLYSSGTSIAGAYEPDLLPITGNTIPVGWHNLTIARDSLGTRVYFDNTLLGVPSSPSTNITTITTTTNQFSRSAWNQNKFGRILGGLLSHVMIYNKGLTTAEVNRNYNALKSRFGI